jgi:hypothetical protein
MNQKYNDRGKAVKQRDGEMKESNKNDNHHDGSHRNVTQAMRKVFRGSPEALVHTGVDELRRSVSPFDR